MTRSKMDGWQGCWPPRGMSRFLTDWWQSSLWKRLHDPLFNRWQLSSKTGELVLVLVTSWSPQTVGDKSDPPVTSPTTSAVPKCHPPKISRSSFASKKKGDQSTVVCSPISRIKILPRWRNFYLEFYQGPILGQDIDEWKQGDSFSFNNWSSFATTTIILFAHSHTALFDQ